MAAPNPSRSTPAGGRVAGAWAAAAVVVAVGSLGFAVVANHRADELEERLDRLGANERAGLGPSDVGAVTRPVAAPSTTAPGATTSTARPATLLDQTAARQSIEFAFRRAYDGASGAAERLAAVDDQTGVEAALRRLFTGPYATEAARLSVVVDAVELTSPTRARVDYRVTLGAIPPSALSGEARVVAGEWKVTRATLCRDLAAFDAACA